MEYDKFSTLRYCTINGVTDLGIRILQGFALIELVIIIASIIIISAIAVTKYIDLAANTQHSATTAISSALSAVNARNYGVRKIHTSHGIAVTDCSDIANTMALPDGYSITAGPVATDKSVSCTLTGPNTTTSTFTATGTS